MCRRCFYQYAEREKLSRELSHALKAKEEAVRMEKDVEERLREERIEKVTIEHLNTRIMELERLVASLRLEHPVNDSVEDEDIGSRSTLEDEVMTDERGRTSVGVSIDVYRNLNSILVAFLDPILVLVNNYIYLD